VIESAYLLRILRQARDRARARAALEGAVAGCALGLALTALAVGFARTRGLAPAWRVGSVLVGVGAGLGMLAGVARRISLVRCARWLDAAVDRGGPGRDRVLSALSLVDAPPTPFTRAVIADAIARAGRLSPKLVAPARRPRGLPALGAAALALGIVALLPGRAPGARREGGSVGAPSAPLEPKLFVAAGLLDAERDAARVASVAAAASGDAALAKLAAELRAATQALATGQLERGEALERLGALAARAQRATDDAARARADLHAAAGAFEPTSATRPLGRALAADDEAATARAVQDLAARAERANDGQRTELARALDAAASAAAADAAKADAQAGPRRLARDRSTAASAANGAADAKDARDGGERQLEHLSRDLEDTAAGCREDAETCARRLRERADSLRGQQREAGSAEARERLESAVRQVRERLRRGDLDERGDVAATRRFARAARGDSSSEGDPARADGDKAGAQSGSGEPAMSDGADSDGMSDESGREGGSGTAPGAGQSAASAEARGQADGIGHGPGGEALGRGALPPTGGHEREAHVRGGAGPSRSEVIEASAHRGFATGDYGRVYDAYAPVVEESLAADAVPEGRRYLVRRYFQLIRPRADAARKP
jgi:hypothetical protein